MFLVNAFNTLAAGVQYIHTLK